MTLAETLLDRALNYLPADKMDLVADAYRFAEKAHKGQTRLSGEPFVEHPLQTALYLAELRLDSSALAAALLHDVMEDCGVGFEELNDQFGEEVAKLVDGVTKLTKTELIAEEREAILRSGSDDAVAQAESLRKMLTYMAEDIRVVLIKLADRLHNMRTLEALPEDRRLSIAQETLDIYAPLAHRLGIWEIKWRLEDLAFQHINTEAYHDISKLLSVKRAEREDYIQHVISVLQGELEIGGDRGGGNGPSKAYLQHLQEDAGICLAEQGGGRHLRPVRPAGAGGEGPGLLSGHGRRARQVAPVARAVR